MEDVVRSSLALLSFPSSLGDADFPPLAPPSRQQSISSLGRSTPPVPPGFEGHHARTNSGERRSTPTIPPGLSKPPSNLVEGDAAKPLSAIPDLDGETSRPSSRASLRRVGSGVVPAVPLRPAGPSRPGTPLRSVSSKVVEGKAPARDKVSTPETPTKAPKTAMTDDVVAPAVAVKSDDQQIAPMAGEATAAADVQAKAEPSKAAAETTQASAPAAESTTTTPVTAVSQPATTTPRKGAPKGIIQPAAKSPATVQASTAKATPVTPSKPEPSKTDLPKKKQPPGKLDIAAAVKKDDIATSAAKATEASTQRDATPGTAKIESPSISSPAVKTAPKTLRVVATPKTETPPTSAMTPKEPVPPIPAVAAAKLPSRQPSVASINPPGTPTSEQISISDNLSMASTSQSRANSPPPGPSGSKVGSAPLRTKTKSQLKKERQERAKAIEEEQAKALEPASKTAVADEPAQEAIVSRKKKTKKEKESKVKPKAPAASSVPAAAASLVTADSTPTASRPATPQQAPAAAAAQQPKVEEAIKDTKSKPSTPTKAPMQPPPVISPGELSPPPTPTLTAAQLVAELKANAPEIQKCIDSLFRSPISNHYKPTQPITAKDIAIFKQEFKIELSQREVHALLNRKISSIRYGGDDGRIWDRGMVTPTGAHLRALTQELENRFLELEKAINDLPEELKFRSTKPQNDVKFPSIDLEALKRSFESIGERGVSAMEQMVQDGSAMKKGAFLVDEASRYVNEFVMPPATPPPSAGVTGGSVTGAKVIPQQQAQQVQQQQRDAGMGISVDVVERQLGEARKMVEEREGQLRKVMKKNRKVLGLS